MVIWMWPIAAMYTYIEGKVYQLLRMMHNNRAVILILGMESAHCIISRIRQIFEVQTDKFLVAMPCSQKCWAVRSKILMSSPCEDPAATAGETNVHMMERYQHWALCELGMCAAFVWNWKRASTMCVAYCTYQMRISTVMFVEDKNCTASLSQYTSTLWPSIYGPHKGNYQVQVPLWQFEGTVIYHSVTTGTMALSGFYSTDLHLNVYNKM